MFLYNKSINNGNSESERSISYNPLTLALFAFRYPIFRYLPHKFFTPHFRSALTFLTNSSKSWQRKQLASVSGLLTLPLRSSKLLSSSQSLESQSTNEDKKSQATLNSQFWNSLVPTLAASAKLLSQNNIQTHRAEVKNAFSNLDKVLELLSGLNPRVRQVSELIYESRTLSDEAKLEKIREVAGESAESPNMELVNEILLYGVRNNNAYAVKLGEYAYLKAEVKLPNWLQFQINQFILNNSDLYNQTKNIMKNPNLASIYNSPNEENSVLKQGESQNLAKTEEISVYAIDHMKYSGLERKFLSQLKQLEQVNAQTKHGLMLI